MPMWVRLSYFDVQSQTLTTLDKAITTRCFLQHKHDRHIPLSNPPFCIATLITDNMPVREATGPWQDVTHCTDGALVFGKQTL